ncbi:MAG: hypothetical protein IJK55_09710 [Bacteroidales bacterium]|nr:hypothetical protein [Bacteroidales bacterium]
MYRTFHKLLLALALMLPCAASHGQGRVLAGTLHSPKGVGATVLLHARNGREMDIFTLRTDFYGLLDGRTRDVGGCFTYSHDYLLWDQDREDYRLRLHAGAGGMLGYVHDFEKGFFSATDRRLLRNPGAMASVTGNVGLCIDFDNRLSLDVSFTVAPGVHLRTDHKTGALLVSFYNNGVIQSYVPQVNLMYRF